MSGPTNVSPERLGEALDVALQAGPDSASIARVRNGLAALQEKNRRTWWIGAGVMLTLGASATAFMLKTRTPLSSRDTVPTQTVAIPVLPSVGVNPPKVPRPPVTRKQWSLGFEPGTDPPMQVSLATDNCPPRTANRGCLRGERGQDREIFAQIVGVRLVDRTRGIWIHRPGARLAFDVWVGETTLRRESGLSVWMNNATQNMPYFLRVNNVVSGRWHHVDVALDDFSPERPHDLDHIDSGDRMDFLLMATRYQTEDVLFVDNVDLWVP